MHSHTKLSLQFLPMAIVSHPAPPRSLPSEAGEVFVWGTECSFGQLGLGEDATEKTRAAPVDIDGKPIIQVGVRITMRVSFRGRLGP